MNALSVAQGTELARQREAVRQQGARVRAARQMQARGRMQRPKTMELYRLLPGVANWSTALPKPTARSTAPAGSLFGLLAQQRLQLDKERTRLNKVEESWTRLQLVPGRWDTRF